MIQFWKIVASENLKTFIELLCGGYENLEIGKICRIKANFNVTKYKITLLYLMSSKMRILAPFKISRI
jgi:hypothetical protein